MKKILVFLGLILFLVVGMTAYLSFGLPQVGKAPDMEVRLTPERLSRGKYLAHHVAACMDCHSGRDWSRFSGPLLEGTLGRGGEYFGPEMGFPGSFYSKNLTPSNLGNWTDGEIFRAITSGVAKDGKALFPVMPYPYYSQMDKEDVLDIIAYLRSLPAIENPVPLSRPEFPMNLIINTLPLKSNLSPKPSKENPVAYGAYLVQVAACMDCHSPVEKGKVIAEKAFSGGREFRMPGGVLRSANLTPDPLTGIGSWTDSVFVARFKAYQEPVNLAHVDGNQFNTLMPWSMYAGMQPEDLRAIYAYLFSLQAVENQVVKFSAFAPEDLSSKAF